jgi:glycosyltransferase involved in cell wall biosynthesis
VTDAFARRNGEIVDGVANTLHRFADHCGQRFTESQLRLTVVTHGQDGDSITDDGPVEVVRFRPLAPQAIHPRWRLDLVPCRRRVVRAITRRRPHLIHIATPGSMGLSGLVAGRALRVPMLGSYHTAYEENIRRRVEKHFARFGLPYRTVGRIFDRLTWSYVIWFYNHMRRVLAPSLHTCATIERRLRVPVGLFSRGVDTTVFHPRFRREPPQVTALFVGRLVVDKNLEALVEIFADRRDVRLVVVGDGPERGWLQRALPRAVFRGHLSGDALSTAYASADLFVFPSETETFGNVVLEAMASGLPVVTSDRMAPRELVEHGVTGFVATVGHDFRSRVEDLIRHPAARLQMGAAARRFAQTRMWEAVFELLLEDYLQVVRKAGDENAAAPIAHPAPALIRHRADVAGVGVTPSA